MAKINIALPLSCSLAFLVMSIISNLPSISNAGVISTRIQPKPIQWSMPIAGTNKLPTFYLKSKTSDGFIKGM
jgi:hypothetical protein